MTPLFILAGIVVALAIVIPILKGGFNVEKTSNQYSYKRKNFFLSRAEHEFYDALVTAIGQEYLVFAQVHLPTIVDNKVVGQNWRGAFKHINEKSVDFVLCDKAYISPKLVIELDDKTHERSDRKERDVEVERILKDVGLPLLRINNHGQFNPVELSHKIKELILK